MNQARGFSFLTRMPALRTGRGLPESNKTRRGLLILGARRFVHLVKPGCRPAEGADRLIFTSDLPRYAEPLDIFRLNANGSAASNANTIYVLVASTL